MAIRVEAGHTLPDDTSPCWTARSGRHVAGRSDARGQPSGTVNDLGAFGSPVRGPLRGVPSNQLNRSSGVARAHDRCGRQRTPTLLQDVDSELDVELRS